MVEAHQLRVGGGIDQRLDLEPERTRGWLRDREAVGRRDEVSSGGNIAPSSLSETRFRPSPSRTTGAGAALAGLGRSERSRTRAAAGLSDTSSSTIWAGSLAGAHSFRGGRAGLFGAHVGSSF